MDPIKISDLPDATEPLVGDELSPIVQSGTTKKFIPAARSDIRSENVEIGEDAASTEFCVAVGKDAVANKSDRPGDADAASGEAIGYGCRATGQMSVAIGGSVPWDDSGWSPAHGVERFGPAISRAKVGIAIGRGAYVGTNGGNSAAIGDQSVCTTPKSFAFGNAAQCFDGGNVGGGNSAEFNIAIGTGVTAKNRRCLAMGRQAIVDAEDTILIGFNSPSSVNDTTATQSIVLGSLSYAGTGTPGAIGNCIAIGRTVAITGNRSIGMGQNVTVSGSEGIAIGHTAEATANFAVGIGADAKTAGSSATGVGRGARATGNSSVAVGRSATAANQDSVAIGYGATISGNTGVAVGLNAAAAVNGTALGGSTTAASGAVALGSAANATTSAVCIGISSAAAGASAVSIGASASAPNANAVVIGPSASSSGPRAVAIGNGAAAAGDTVAIGDGAASSGARSTALGDAATASNADSVALGQASATTTGFQVAIGPRHIELLNVASDPTAPANNAARLFLRETGGKEELCVRFATGAIQVIATEP